MYRLRLSSHIKSSRCTSRRRDLRVYGITGLSVYVARDAMTARCNSKRKCLVLTRKTKRRSARIDGPNAQMAYESINTAGGTWSRDIGSCMTLLAHPHTQPRSAFHRLRAATSVRCNVIVTYLHCSAPATIVTASEILANCATAAACA